jgi:hypothetical protein
MGRGGGLHDLQQRLRRSIFTWNEEELKAKCIAILKNLKSFIAEMRATEAGLKQN